jgi:high-affinity K+ transport system ATPase subunit B
MIAMFLAIMAAAVGVLVAVYGFLWDTTVGALMTAVGVTAFICGTAAAVGLLAP